MQKLLDSFGNAGNVFSVRNLAIVHSHNIDILDFPLLVLITNFIYLDLAIRTNTCLCIIDEVMIILAGDLLCKSQCLDRDCDRPHPRHHHRPPPQNTLWEEPARSDLTIARSKYPLA